MSNSKLKSADFSINEAAKQSSYRSYASKNDMKVMLKKAIRELHQMGFKVAHVKGLKAKHVYALIDKWKSEDKSCATMKNYLSKFRELAKITNNPKLVKTDNSAYELWIRKYYPDHNKAINKVDFDKCSDPLIRLSLEGQYLFGLRREEAIKFTLSQAYQGLGCIRLECSWTKGGIGRVIPISNQEQRDWLKRVGETVEQGQSLIHKGLSYKDQLSKYTYQIRMLGLKSPHGLRHAYAQRRYLELTRYYDPKKEGWGCPYNGGKQFDDMSEKEQHIDIKVRNLLTRELGHSRLSILKSYLG